MLIIGPNPFISQSSPDHSPQHRIDFSYYEISGPDICSLICDYNHLLITVFVSLSCIFSFSFFTFFFSSLPCLLLWGRKRKRSHNGVKYSLNLYSSFIGTYNFTNYEFRKYFNTLWFNFTFNGRTSTKSLQKPVLVHGTFL